MVTTYIYGIFYRFGMIDVPDEVKEKKNDRVNKKTEEASESIKAKQWTKKQSHKFFKQECMHHPQRIASLENMLWQRKVQKLKPSSNGRGNQSGEKRTFYSG